MRDSWRPLRVPRWRLAALVLVLALVLSSYPIPQPATAGMNTWTPVTVPYAMNITALAVSPAYPCDRTVFMGTDSHGVFRTSDAADSIWMPINAGLFDQGVLALAVSPNYGRCDRLTERGDRTLFVGTRSGVFRSQNGGASWELRSQGLPQGAAVQALAISPNYTSDRTVYAGFDGSLYRSTDGGATWGPFDAGLTDRSVQAFALSANYANDNTLFVGTRFSGVYRIAARLQQPAAGPGLPAAAPAPAAAPTATPPSALPAPGALPTVPSRLSKTQGAVAPALADPGGEGPPQSGVPVAEPQPLQRAGALQVMLWACNEDGSLCAADGAEWTTVPGLVTLKLEIKNIGTQTVRNILVTDDNGTPDNSSDDILINAANPTLTLDSGGAALVQRRLVVNTDRGASGTNTRPFVWTARGVCGATYEECSPAAVASDDAIVRVISTQTQASIRLEITAGNSFFGQTYYTVPGPAPLNLRVINDGNQAVRNVQLILDPAGNDNPGCRDNPGTDTVNETNDDLLIGNVPSLGSGQQATVATSINVKPPTEGMVAGATPPPIRIQGCATATAGEANNPINIFANGDALLQLVVWQSITPSGSALSNLWVTSFAISSFYANDQTIFAGTAYGGLYRSTNAATANPTWDLVNQGLEPTFTWVRAIALSPRYPFDRTLYVGTESGVFRGTEASPGGPITWVPMSRGLAVKDVRALGISPDYGRDTMIFAAASGADVYRLKAAAQDVPWEPYRRVINGLWSWAVALTQDGVLLNGTWGRGVGRMVLPTGAGWSSTQPGFPGDAEVTVLAVSPGYCSGYTAFAGTWAHGLYHSRDAGATWTATTYPVSYGPVRDIAVAPSYARGHTLAVATWGSGVLISHNDGVSWFSINAGLPDLTVRAVAFSPGYPSDETLYVGTESAGLFRYDASQARWVPVGPGLPSGPIMAVALSPNFMDDGTLLAGTWGSGVFISRDWGARWSAAGIQVNPYVRSLAFSPTYGSDGAIYAGTNRGLYRSGDRGGSWSLVGAPSDEVAGVDVTDITLTMSHPRTIFVSTGGRGIWQFTESATVASYQTSQLFYRAFIPIVAKGRPGSIC